MPFDSGSKCFNACSEEEAAEAPLEQAGAPAVFHLVDQDAPVAAAPAVALRDLEHPAVAGTDPQSLRYPNPPFAPA